MRIALVSLVGLIVTACAHPGVVRVDPRSTIDLSGHWNDADANQVADALVPDCLHDGWAEKFAAAHDGRAPVVRLYPVRNRSDDHVDGAFFTKQLESALLRSGRVKVVDSFVEAADNRGERADQAAFASPATQHPGHQETGADYVLDGWVLTQNDATDGAEVRAYLVTLELSDTTTNEKVWIGSRQIKKLVVHD